MLLCIDLHAENGLAAQREPWLVVDPKPYVGDGNESPKSLVSFPCSRAERTPRVPD